jgi:hypothetical protein
MFVHYHSMDCVSTMILVGTVSASYGSVTIVLAFVVGFLLSMMLFVDCNPYEAASLNVGVSIP